MREIVAMMGVGYPNMFQEGSAGKKELCLEEN